MSISKSFYEISLWKDRTVIEEKDFNQNEVLQYDLILHIEEDSFGIIRKRQVFYNKMTPDNKVSAYYYSGQEKIDIIDIEANFKIQYKKFKEEKYLVIGSSEMTYPGRAINPRLTTNVNGTKTFSFDLKDRFFNPETEEFEDNYLVPFLQNEVKIKLHTDNNWETFVLKTNTKSREKRDITYTFTCEDIFINELSQTGWELVFDEEQNGIGTIDELGKRVFEDTDWTYLPVKQEDFKETITEFKKDENGNFIKDENGNYIEETKEVNTPITEFNQDLKRVVTQYKKSANPNEKVWGYSTTEIVTSEVAQNIATNYKDFIDTTGWIAQDSTVTLGAELSEKNDSDPTKNIYSLGVSKSTSQRFFNSGIASNKIVYKGEDTYAIRVVYCFDNYVPNSTQSGLTFNINRLKLESNGSYSIPEKIYTNDLPITSSSYYIIRPRNSISMAKAYLGFNFAANKKLLIQDIQFFKVAPKTKNDEIYVNNLVDMQSVSETDLKAHVVLPGDIPEAYINNKMNYFEYDNDGNIVYLDESTIDPNPIYVEGAQKVRTLKVEKSNRFNISQNIAELFECFLRPTIIYENNGEISSDENGRPKKYVTFAKDVGIENFDGFHYGINLVNISRTSSNEDFVTKMFVEDNDCEYVDSGIVTIKNASENFSKEGFVLNFNYYIMIGELSQPEVINDLYQTSSTSMGIGYFTKLNRLNSEYEEKSEIRFGLNNTLDSLNSQKTVLTLQIDSINELIRELTLDINDQSRPLTPAQKKEKQDLIDMHKKNLSVYKSSLESVNNQITKYTTDITSIKNRLDEILTEKRNLHRIFNTKYSRFINEGTWQDSNYLDDNKFYLDAVSVSNTSSKPNVTYTLNAIDVSSLPGLENFKMEVGDKTFITDVEFFGKDKNGAPIREEVVVSEIEEFLDRPDQTTISIQNYTTKFEDLFSRLTATTQALQLNEQTYSRAENFTPTGEINLSTLQSSLINNSLVLSQTKDQSVLIDSNGIELSDVFNMSKKMRIISSGIFISKDGGTTWPTGITADGMSASFITSGQIDVNKIRIMNGLYPSFTFDSEGLTAYKITDEGIALTNIFVRFDQYGMYMVNSDSEFSIDNELPWSERIKLVKDQSLVNFTWDGFSIKSYNNSIDINSTDDFTTYEIKQTGEKILRLKIGRIEQNDDGSSRYGLMVKADLDKTTLKTIDTGDLLLSGNMFIGNIDQQNYNIGITWGAEDNRVIWFKNLNEYNFSIYRDGTLEAKNANIEGNIIARTGEFHSGFFLNRIDIGSLPKTITIDEFYGGDYTVNSDTSIVPTRYEAVIQIEKNKFDFYDTKKYFISATYISNGVRNTVDVNDFIITEYSISQIAEETIDIPIIEVKFYVSSDKNNISDLVLNFNSKSSYGYINGDAYSVDSNVIHFGDLEKYFYVNKDGNAFMKGAQVDGEINAQSGSITGRLTIGDSNENFFLDGTEENEIRLNAGDNFNLDKYGNVTANSIKLGDKAEIKTFIGFKKESNLDYYNAKIINPSQNSSKIFIISDDITLNENDPSDNDFCLTANGELYSSKLKITGDGSEIVGSLKITNGNNSILFDKDGIFNGEFWNIKTDGSAVFNNVTVRGTIESVVFKYDEIQTSSGSILVRPSAHIVTSTYDSSSKRLEVTVGEDIDASAGDFVRIQLFSATDSSDRYIESTIAQVDTLNTKHFYINLNESLSEIDYNGKIVINLGGENDVGIVINSQNSTAFGSVPAGITMYKNTILEDNSRGMSSQLIIGDLSKGNYPDEYKDFVILDETNSYGIYADNAILRGMLVTGTTNNSAGMTTSDNDVLIWAGGPFNNKLSSKFYVTKDGSLFAKDGIFEGQINTDNATIGGSLAGNGLIINSGSDGMFFTYDKDVESVTKTFLSTSIDRDGVAIWGEGNFRVYDAPVDEEFDKDIWINGNKAKYMFNPYAFSDRNIRGIAATSLLTFEDSSSTNTIYSGIKIDRKSINFVEINKQSVNTNLNNVSAFAAASSRGSISIDSNKNMSFTSVSGFNFDGNVNVTSKITSDDIQFNTKMEIAGNAILKPVYKEINGEKINNGYDLYIVE